MYKVARTDDKATRRGKGLGQSTHNNLYPILQAKLFNSTRPTLTQHPRTMCIINHEKAIMGLRHVSQLREWCHVAVHAEHSVRDDESTATISRHVLDQSAQMIHVTMTVNGYPSLRQTASVDDTGVVQLVAEYDVTPTN